MTFIEQLKEQIAATQAETIATLGWSADQYAQYVYDCGLNYLFAYLPDDKDGRQQLERQSLFWNWWKLNFHRRNDEFLRIVESLPQDEQMGFYHLLNNAYELVRDIRPGKNVVGNAFATIK